jgi:hypothetical protein
MSSLTQCFCRYCLLLSFEVCIVPTFSRIGIPEPTFGGMMAHGAATKVQETRLDRMERWFRNQPIFSVLILAGIALIGLSEVVQKGSDLLIVLRLKQEKTLQLAAENAKGELSRKLIELAWRRLFWTENYIARMEAHRPPSELDYTWNKHLETVADWSSEYMVNLNGMEQFYPNSVKAAQFQSIHEKFRDLEYNHVVQLRKAELEQRDLSNDLDSAKKLANQLNEDLFYFALNKSGEEAKK